MIETTITTPIAGRVQPAARRLHHRGHGDRHRPASARSVHRGSQNRDTGQWLQPTTTTWGGAANIEATVTPTSATEATWSVTLNVPGNRRMLAPRPDPGSTAQCRARGPGKAIKKFETFGLDDAPPTTGVRRPPRLRHAHHHVHRLRHGAGRRRRHRHLDDAPRRRRPLPPGRRHRRRDLQHDRHRPGRRRTRPAPRGRRRSPSRRGRWTMQAIARDTEGNSSLDTYRPHLERAARRRSPAVSIARRAPWSRRPPPQPR